MSRRRRRGLEDANISFLDIICCGFGAIVLLLVIVRPNPPVVIEESLIQDKGQVRALQERLFEIRGQVKYLETDLNAKQEQLGKDQRRVAILRSEFDELNSRKPSSEDEGAEDATTAEDLQIALQTLTREMKRLLQGRKKANEYIAGVAGRLRIHYFYHRQLRKYDRQRMGALGTRGQKYSRHLPNGKRNSGHEQRGHLHVSIVSWQIHDRLTQPSTQYYRHVGKLVGVQYINASGRHHQRYSTALRQRQKDKFVRNG